MPEQQWFLYIIRAKDNSLYTGVTTDIQRRFLEHQGLGKKAGAKYLRGRSPLILEFSQEIGNLSEALRMEIKVKKLSRKEKERLIFKARPLPQL